MSAGAGPGGAAPPAAPQRSLRKLLKRLIQPTVLLVFLAFLIIELAKRWDLVRDGIGELSVTAVAVSMVAMLGGIWCGFMCWWTVIVDLGAERVPLTGAMRVFFIGQAGKYLPGKLWPILTQTRLGREYNIPARASSAAAAIFMLMLLGAGLLVSVCTLPLLGDDTLERYWWTLLVLPLALVMLWPPVLNRCMALALRLMRREAMPAPLSMRGAGIAALWVLATWVLWGAHLWVLMTDLGAGGSTLPIRATGVYAASWSIGFLLLIAPAGAGPREAAMILLLRPILPAGQALLLALVTRLLMTIGDLIWPVIAVIAERFRRGRLAASTRALTEGAEQQAAGTPAGHGRPAGGS
jgi:glycosyltransferase 2 family protein